MTALINTTAAGRFFINNYGWALVASALLLLSTATLSLVPLGIMAAVGIYRVGRNPGVIYKHKSSRALLLLFLCLWLPQLISLVDAVNLARSAKTVLSYPLYLFCGIFIVLELAKPGNFSRLSLAFLVIATAWCIDAFIQYATGVNLFGYPYEAGGLSGMFYPKLRLGIVLAVLVPIVLEALRKTNKENVLSWLILAPFVVVVLLSGRRSAWIMLVLGLLAYVPLVFLTLSRNTKYILLVAVCIVSLLVAYVCVKNPEINRRVILLTGIFSSAQQAEWATSNRTPVWDTAYNMLEDNWINGVGPRSFRYGYKAYADEDNLFIQQGRTGQTHPHLVFLEIAVETGLIGIAGFILFYFTVLRFWWRGRRDTGAVAWTSSVLAAAFPLNAHMAFYGSYWGGFLWLLIACAISAASARQGE